jgi:hypothetical protein
MIGVGPRFDVAAPIGATLSARLSRGIGFLYALGYSLHAATAVDFFARRGIERRIDASNGR